MLAVSATGLVAVSALASWFLLPLEGEPAVLGGELSGMEAHAREVLRDVRLRAWGELAVVGFQVAAIASLGLSRLLPRTRWADRGRHGFVLAMIGLGASGILCASYHSQFALFAGGTLAVMLNVVILGRGGPVPRCPRLAAAPDSPMSA